MPPARCFVYFIACPYSHPGSWGSLLSFLRLKTRAKVELKRFSEKASQWKTRPQLYMCTSEGVYYCLHCDRILKNKGKNEVMFISSHSGIKRLEGTNQVLALFKKFFHQHPANCVPGNRASSHTCASTAMFQEQFKKGENRKQDVVCTSIFALEVCEILSGS